MKYRIRELDVGDPVPIPPNPPSEVGIRQNWGSGKEGPLVTVICHTYNHGPFIRDALNGFLIQKTDFPFEILVHDDASTDDTREIVSEYAGLYPSIIRTICQDENQVQKGIRPNQFTLPRAQGRFIAFCEGDDYWLDPEKLQKQADFLKHNSGYSICAHDAFIFQEGRLVKHSKLPDSLKKDFNPETVRREFLYLTMSAMFINVFKNIPFEMKFVLNGDTFILSLLGNYGAYKYMEDLGPAAYRLHPGAVWSGKTAVEKKAERIKTQYWLMQYHLRNENRDTALSFSRQISYTVFNQLDEIKISDTLVFFRDLVGLYLKKKAPIMFYYFNRIKGIFSSE